MGCKCAGGDLRREEGSGLIGREDVRPWTPDVLLVTIAGSEIPADRTCEDVALALIESMVVVDMQSDGTRRPGGSSASSSESSDKSVSSVSELGEIAVGPKTDFVGLGGIDGPRNPSLAGNADVSRQDRMSKVVSECALESCRSRLISSPDASEEVKECTESARELEARFISSLSSPLRRFWNQMVICL